MKRLLNCYLALPLILWAIRSFDGSSHPYRVGRVAACSRGSLFQGSQAEIVAYGLGDARGLAIRKIEAQPTPRPQKRQPEEDNPAEFIYVAGLSRPVLAFDAMSGKFVLPKGKDLLGQACPDGECQDNNDRDLSVSKDEALITGSGYAGLDRRAIRDNEVGHRIDLGIDGTENLSDAVGIWNNGRVSFVVVDNLVDASGSPIKVHTGSGALYSLCLPSAPIQQRLVGNSTTGTHSGHSFPSSRTQQPSPAESTAERQPCPSGMPTGLSPVGKDLIHPSGVTAVSPTGPVYVAEERANSVSWAVFQQAGDGSWKRLKDLASVPKENRPLGMFLGAAYWCELWSLNSGQSRYSPTGNCSTGTERTAMGVLFMAGPGGLFAFTPEGESVGRIDFDEPVNGVAVSTNSLFVVVGKMLCKIDLRGLSVKVDDWNRWRTQPEPPPRPSGVHRRPGGKKHGSGSSRVLIKTPSPTRPCDCKAK